MKKINVRTMIILALVAALVLLVFLQLQTTTKEVTYQVSVVVNDSNSNRWTRFKAGLEQAAEDYNVNLNVVITDSLDSFDEESALLDTEISNGADALIVQLASDEGAAAYISNASKKIPISLVETLVTPNNTADRTYCVTMANNSEIGNALAEMILDDCGTVNDKTVGIYIGNQSLNSMRDRYHTLSDVLQENGCSSIWTCSSSDELRLHQETEPASILISIDNNGLEIISTYAKDLKEKPMIYGVGCSDSSIYSLDKGTINGMIVPNEYIMGYYSLSKVASHLNNKLTQMQDTEINYFTVNKENLYSSEYQKMLFPIVN